MVAWMSFMVRCVTAFGRERGVDDRPGPPALAPVDRAEDEIGKTLSHWRGIASAFRRASWRDIRSSFQSLCFGQADEILNPLQSTVSSHAFLQPRSTGWVVIEGDYEGLAALVCQPHQFVGNRRSRAAHNRPGIAATGVDRPIAQGVDGRFDCNNDFRFVEMADREPGGELVSKARAKGGLVPGVPQSRSFDFSVLGPVEENDAWIRAVVVGEDRSHRVQIVHNGGIDPACFDQIGAGNRPVRFAWNSVSRRQFVKGLAFLFGIGCGAQSERTTRFRRWKRLENPSRGSDRRRQSLRRSGASGGQSPLALRRPALLSNQRFPVTTML